ncbi:alpha/beta hydrolase family protein [Tautonia sociabilis]|uniref:Alpha/beta hydrolase n=1 Tax=Tautonia sociabilis TaxID=2080755 RepID=A0A432MGG3_9BACT|nr:alpha/beta hydrolase [Tautonia sociabilis]RUL85612.1 alpha/beta hydrolase [Tautonia sociabilis]
MVPRCATAWPLLLIAAPTLAGQPDAPASADAVEQLREAIGAGPGSLDHLVDAPFARVPLTRADAEKARSLVWEAHADRIRRDRAEEIQRRVIEDGELAMPFSFTRFGEKPDRGWSLFISMHGGGHAPARVNDRQWENQKTLYEVEEGIYLAPRAPTNTWNLWHEPHIDRMFGRLIENLIVLEGVDPDRVYLLGYSAGGDGVYQLAPRMADRWAAAAMMAGHPNGVSVRSLRNVPFALQVGGDDSAYNRNTVARAYGDRLDALQAADPGGYEHFVKIYEGKGHWMDREDRVALPWMAQFSRNPVPQTVIWEQTGTPHERSYWLAVPPEDATLGSIVVATRDGQEIHLTEAEGVSTLLIRLDDRMADLDRPISVSIGGEPLFEGIAPRTIATLLRTLAGRGDPGLLFDAEVAVTIPDSGTNPARRRGG